jgi:tetratricopeptide (TPR) repeat protein
MSILVDGIKFSGSQTTIEEKIKKLKSFSNRDDETDQSQKGKAIMFKSRLTRQQTWLALAASVVLAAFVLYTIINRESFFGKPDLYAKYFEPFDSPGSGLTRSGDDSITLKVQAYAEYDNGNYTEASKLFEQYLENNDDAIAHLCLGNTYLAMGELDKAETNFLHMLKEHNDLVTQTKWYLALTYLKQNKLEKARATLWEISKSSTYGAKAKSLLDELD